MHLEFIPTKITKKNFILGRGSIIYYLSKQLDEIQLDDDSPLAKLKILFLFLLIQLYKN